MGSFDGFGKTSLRARVDFGPLRVEQSGSQFLGALRQRLPQGDDVTFVTSASPGSYHVRFVVGERSDESYPFARRRKRKQRSALGEFVVLKQDKGLFRGLTHQRSVPGDGSGYFHALGV